MKKLHLLILAMLSCYLVVSCTKKNQETVLPVSLMGKWSVAADTTATGGALVDFYDYTGLPEDYFDFRADGKCYVKEGNKYDTLGYSITSDTTLDIESFGFSNKAFYTKPTNPYHTAIITSTGPYVPGGYDYRRVKLTR